MGTEVTLSSPLRTLLLTGLDDFGCTWHIETPIQGFDAPAGSTLALQQKGRQHGGYAGPAYLTPLEVTLHGKVEAPDIEAMVLALDRLSSAIPLDDIGTLLVTRGSIQRTVFVQQEGGSNPPDFHEIHDTLYEITIPLVAPDPRKYGPLIVVADVAPASSTGGLTWPVTWPIEWDGVTTTGAFSVHNSGNMRSPIYVRVDGPAPNVRIRSVVGGVTRTVGLDYTVPAGSYIEFDMENETILEGGTSTRDGYVTDDDFFALEPGNNDFYFTADNPAARLTLTTRSANK